VVEISFSTLFFCQVNLTGCRNFSYWILPGQIMDQKMSGFFFPVFYNLGGFMSDLSKLSSSCCRFVRSLSRQVQDCDPTDLKYLLVVGNVVESCVTDCVLSMRRAGYTWQEIANDLGVSKQWVHQKYSRVG